MIDVVIIGQGQHAYVAANILELNPEYRVLGFIDKEPKGERYLGSDLDIEKFISKGCHFFVGIGDNYVRGKLFQELDRRGVKFVNAIHPTALIEKNVSTGRGVMVGARSYINVHTAIGDGVIINSGCIIEHDNTVEEFAHCAAGVITGTEAKIGAYTLVGLATVINGYVRIGKESTIGSGSVVIADVPEHVTAVGRPVRVIKRGAARIIRPRPNQHS